MKRFILPAILLLAFLFRFASVSSQPYGLNADEASFGYDAYSILHTGRDQWGTFAPVLLKSFGDFKSPVYSYLAVPSVSIFGLTVFATRLPNVIMGTLSVLAVYLLVNDIAKRSKWLDGYMSKWLGTIAAILLAVNPWGVMISRGAVEASLITFFLPMGIYFFIRGIRENKFFIWSAVFFGINMFTYHSAKVITPAVLIGLLLIFRSQILKINLKKLKIPLIIFLIFFGGMVYTFTAGGGSRVAERSITQGALEQGFQERVAAESGGLNPTAAKILHNKYQVIAGHFVFNYLQYFSSKFLINNGVGDASYAMIPGIGVIYVIEGVLLLGAAYLFFAEKKSRFLILALLAWLVITPLPASLASGIGYSGNRASGMIPVLQIIEALGLLGWILLINKFDKRAVKFAGVLFGIIFIFEIYSFTRTYFKIPSTLILKQEDYGSLQAAEWLNSNSNGRKVLVSRSLSEPQIFIAFASKWNPTDFQKSTKSWNYDKTDVTWVDQLSSYSLGKYTIKSIDWKTDIGNNTLIAVKADEFTGNQIPVKTFNYPDGTPNIYIIDTSQKMYAKTN